MEFKRSINPLKLFANVYVHMFIFLMRDSANSHRVCDLSPNKLFPHLGSKYKQNEKVNGILRKMFLTI